MDAKVMTPSQVWLGYDPKAEPLEVALGGEEQDGSVRKSTYTFTALTDGDERLRVAVDVYPGSGDRAIVIVQEYTEKVQKNVIYNLAQEGYTVVVPDYSGLGKTTFPTIYAYGRIFDAGEHLTEVCPTARETCQYLYSVIIKRCLTFVSLTLEIDRIALIGIGSGAEVAIQVAGTDNRPNSVVCINAAGYKEYANKNKYGDHKETAIGHKLMCWLTGVAAVAYVKHVSVPIFVAISSNGHDADIDRLQNFLGLAGEEQVSIVITPLSHDSIDEYSYRSMKLWLKKIFDEKPIPRLPDVRMFVSEGILYAEIKADAVEKISSVKFYFSFGEYNHTVRNWRPVACQTVGEDEYLATFTVSDDEAPLFGYAEVEYAGGSRLCSAEEYLELKGLSVRTVAKKHSRIAFDCNGQGLFVEDAEKEIIIKSGLSDGVTPLGLKGIKSDIGALISYDIGTVSDQNEGNLLQLDLFSNEDRNVSVTLFHKSDGSEGDSVREYTAQSRVLATKGAFFSIRFNPGDFKDDRLMPLESWAGVKAVRINESEIMVGKILFI